MRIFLTEGSTEHLLMMVKEMRAVKGVSLSPSDLGSWVVEFFFKTQFEKQRTEIANHFIDFKKLVLDSLKTASSQEELIHSLKDSLAVAHANRTPKKSVNKTEMKSNKDELKDK